MLNSFDSPGSKTWSFDLHIHTPSSHDYRDKSATPDDIVAAAIAANLNAIAITDHNQVDFIDRIRDAARDTHLVVFPGVEISASGGHVLAIFDIDEPVSTLEDLLVACGIERSKFGDDQAIGGDIREVVTSVSVKGGIAIAAHIELDTGFLHRRIEGPLQTGLSQHPGLNALEITKSEERHLWLKGRHPEYSHLKTPHACVQGSDSHTLASIGAKRIFIKMESPSLRGLKLACDDPAVNIFFPDDLPNLAFPRIISLEVSKGFLSQSRIEFNSGLNCLVGGKGTGKSTLIEFIRFALGQVSELPEISKDTHYKVSELAGPGSTISVVVRDESGYKYRISRLYDGAINSTSVYRLSSDGNDELLDSINVSQLFKIHAFSQGEATVIARKPPSRMQLVDDHIDLTQENDRISQIQAVLAENRNSLLSLSTNT